MQCGMSIDPQDGKPRRTSVVIEEIVEDCVEDGVVTVHEFLKQMGHKALALAILVFSISAVIAGIIPGFSTLVAIPIIFIALQIALGRTTVYLPRSIRQKEISPKVINDALTQSLPTLRWIERFMRPRLTLLTTGIFARSIAILIMILAGILALPIPGGNFLPSFTITLLAIAILERDGVFLLLTIGTLFLTGKLMIDLIEKAAEILMQLI